MTAVVTGVEAGEVIHEGISILSVRPVCGNDSVLPNPTPKLGLVWTSASTVVNSPDSDILITSSETSDRRRRLVLWASMKPIHSSA